MHVCDAARILYCNLLLVVVVGGVLDHIMHMHTNGEKQYCHCCHCTVLLLFYDLSCTGSLHQTRSLHHPIASQLILESSSALLSLVRVYPRYSDYPLLAYDISF